MPPDAPAPGTPAEPTSLTGHTVPADRRATIDAHVAALAATALAVSERLPLQTDAGDIFAVMDEDADKR